MTHIEKSQLPQEELKESLEKVVAGYLEVEQEELKKYTLKELLKSTNTITNGAKFKSNVALDLVLRHLEPGSVSRERLTELRNLGRFMGDLSLKDIEMVVANYIKPEGELMKLIRSYLADGWKCYTDDMNPLICLLTTEELYRHDMTPYYLNRLNSELAIGYRETMTALVTLLGVDRSKADIVKVWRKEVAMAQLNITAEVYATKFIVPSVDVGVELSFTEWFDRVIGIDKTMESVKWIANEIGVKLSDPAFVNSMLNDIMFKNHATTDTLSLIHSIVNKIISGVSVPEEGQ